MKRGTWALLALLATAAVAGADAQSPQPAALAAALNRTVSVQFPDSHNVLPPGAGADIANTQCMICHSAGMITRQPPLSMERWKEEVEKMRTAYGAPLPEDQVETVAKYLAGINRKP
ncbi:cytochrome c [Paraburkholderia sp. FT54]|jgi:mono/diheme cytochrome c family protein|uniref:c-type cytochrome n=1 Tax=Paraburkholderia sp. FT54 TaxID=3074437 RepID=UPI0028775237|nr:cytochrome c [Paraburkholderia sp. FT54]WNC94415.1 cytochrome c [Paraburkholderia sp. FT54]